MTRVRKASFVVVVVAILALTPGCVGVGWIGSQTLDTKPTVVNGLRKRPWTPRFETADVVLARLGEPDERASSEDGTEVWTYEDGWRWAGLGVFAIIPIPIAVPVGTEKSTFFLRRNDVEREIRVRTRWFGVACGFLGHQGIGCDSEFE